MCALCSDHLDVFSKRYFLCIVISGQEKNITKKTLSSLKGFLFKKLNNDYLLITRSVLTTVP